VAKHRRSNKQASPSARLTKKRAFKPGPDRDVAKHDKRRRSPELVLASAMAAGVSAALVFGHATNTTADTSQVQLAASVIGIGGRGDPTASNIPNKLHRDPITGDADGTIIPRPGYDPAPIPVNYPAGFDIDNSVAAGVLVLHREIINRPGETLLIVGYSEGALVAERERRNLAANPGNTDPEDISYIMIASANLPNGGIFARFPNLNLLIVSSNGAAQPTASDTTYYTNEYDPYADFPAYFNPFSLLNSLAAVFYVHPDAYYDTVDPDAPDPIVKTVTNPALGSTDTYIFVPAKHLPLLQLPRDISAAFGLTALTEPFISAIEPVLRVLVDMGYTDRENLNPEVPTTFSLITPPAKIGEAIGKLPGAIAEGAQNFVEGIGGVTSAETPSSTPFSTAWKPANSLQVETLSGPQAPQQRSIINDQTDLSAAGTLSQTPPQTNGSSNAQSNLETNPQTNGSSDPQTNSSSNLQSSPQSNLQTNASSNSAQSTSPATTSTPTSPSTPSGPQTGQLGELSPFSLDKKDAPTDDPNGTTSTATKPGGRLANTVSDTITGLLGGKPKPSSPSTPSSPQSDTDTPAQGQQAAA
jgi:hypothetical protein